MDATGKHLSEVVKLYYERKSATVVSREMQKRHPDLEKLNRRRIYRIVRKFEEKGSVHDGRHEHSGRPKTGRSEQNIGKVMDVIQETPQKSVRQVLKDINNTTSVSSVYRILKFELKLTPYKISIMQLLKETDVSSRLEFAEWMTNEPAEFTDKIWFSDESHFHLNNAVNKQNFRFWGSEKPTWCVEKPLHSAKVTVWAALSSTGIIGPFFIEDSDGETTTVNSERYLDLLKKKFLPALRRRDDPKQVVFQQDGAAPHTATCVLQWLGSVFGNNVISLKTAKVWPPHSPDLSPLDFFLWGYLKDRVYYPPPTSTEELKRAITREIRKISPATCAAVIANFRQRTSLVIERKGRHLEHIL